MSDDILRRRLDAVAAMLDLAKAQLDLARAEFVPVPSVAVPAIPARCHGVTESKCALRDTEAGTALMGGTVFCGGCQERLTPQ